ncbi:MAG: hypothetical protein AAFR76_01390 [Planctomycetota bacterium]
MSTTKIRRRNRLRQVYGRTMSRPLSPSQRYALDLWAYRHRLIKQAELLACFNRAIAAGATDAQLVQTVSIEDRRLSLDQVLRAVSEEVDHAR